MSWAWPSASLLLPPLVLTLQASLIQVPQSFALRIFRLLLGILSSITIHTSCSTFFEPKKDFILFNAVIHIAKAWAILRSIEFATARHQYTWIGYQRAYDSQERRSKGKAENHRNFLQAIYYGWSCVCSMRGIGWDWGISGKNIPPTHPLDSDLAFVASLLIRIAWLHPATVAAVAFLKLSREKGSTGKALEFILGSTLDPKISRLAGLVGDVMSFGVGLFATLELGYALLTLVVYLLTTMFRVLLPQSLAPAPFEKRAWPRLMKRPYGGASLSEFWGKRWHALFRRQYVFLGSSPATRTAERLGAGKQTQRALGLMAAFFLSGVMHEAYNAATPWLPRDPYYRSFAYFFVQSFGILLENIYRQISGKRVSGIAGFVWTFAFLSVTGSWMGDCWIERGLVDYLPPVGQWSWCRLYVPLGFIIPNV